MSRIETIEDQLRDAMKAREAERRDALRLILNALKSSEKELRTAESAVSAGSVHSLSPAR